MQPLIDNARLFVHALITGARSADLFELRTAGNNAVPPFASVIPIGRHREVPGKNVRGHRMAPGTFESVRGS